MNSEYDMDDSERYGCGWRTYRFRHRHWTAAAIAEMRGSGEWNEDKDNEDDEDEEYDDEETGDCDVEEFPDCR